MSEHDKIKEQMYAWTAKYAENNGFKLNPDKEIYDIVIDGLVKNKEKTGKRYCPCRIVIGDEEQDKKIVCPCIYHKDEIEKDGMCHCALFFKD